MYHLFTRCVPLTHSPVCLLEYTYPVYLKKRERNRSSLIELRRMNEPLMLFSSRSFVLSLPCSQSVVVLSAPLLSRRGRRDVLSHVVTPSAEFDSIQCIPFFPALPHCLCCHSLLRPFLPPQVAPLVCPPRSRPSVRCPAPVVSLS